MVIEGVVVVGVDRDDRLMILAAGEHDVLSDWLCDELQTGTSEAVKCTNDWEQSGHSRHEYWICVGVHLHDSTSFRNPTRWRLY